MSLFIREKIIFEEHIFSLADFPLDLIVKTELTFKKKIFCLYK